MSRFQLMNASEARDAEYSDPEGYAEDWVDSFDDPYVLVDTKENEIVFLDGNYDSPEDNYLFRHFGGLVDLLNKVADGG